MTKDRIAKYAIGFLIALGIYAICAFIGSMFNVLMAFAAGYENYKDLIASGNLAGILLIFAFSGINHLFFAWLTVKLMSLYGIKTGCAAERWYYRSTAIVLLLFIWTVIPLITSHTVGWLVWGTHAGGIALFGKSKAKKITGKTQAEAASPGTEPISHTVSVTGTTEVTKMADVPEGPVYAEGESLPGTQVRDAVVYCKYCGTKLSTAAKFCHKCGAQISQH